MLVVSVHRLCGGFCSSSHYYDFGCATPEKPKTIFTPVTGPKTLNGYALCHHRHVMTGTALSNQYKTSNISHNNIF